MNTSELVYQGDLRTLATHVYSGTTIFTDAPLDNQGKAQSFSPTDLVATALASCIITTIAILLKNEPVDWEGTKLNVRKIMASTPRRIAEIQIDIDLRNVNLDESLKQKVQHIANTCPVAMSLNTDLKQSVNIAFG